MDVSRSRWLVVPERLSWWIALPIVLAPIVVQLALGVHVELAMLAAAVGLLGFALLNVGGLYHAGSVLAFIFVAKYVLIALYAKTLMGQPLQSHLPTAVDAYGLVLVGTLGLGAALLAAHVIPVGRPLLPALDDPRFLRYLSVACTVIGLGAWLAHQQLAGDVRAEDFDASEHIGAFGVVRPLAYMGIVAATARVLVDSEGRRSLDVWVIVLLIANTATALIDAQKEPLLYTFLAYVLPCVAFRRAITTTQLAVLIPAALIAIFVASPLIHHYREQIWGAALTSRVELLTEEGPESLSIERIEQFQQSAEAQAGRAKVAYFGRNHLILDRFAMVQYLDAPIAAVNQRGYVSPSILLHGLRKVPPRAIYADKPLHTSGDQILWELGQLPYGLARFRVMPMLAECYAVGGWWVCALVPPGVLLVFFLVLKKVGWTLAGNVFACFFVVHLQWRLPGNMSNLVVETLRVLPFLAVVLLGLVWIYQVTVQFHAQDRERCESSA